MVKKYGHMILKQKGMIFRSEDQKFLWSNYLLHCQNNKIYCSENWNLTEDDLNRIFQRTAFNFCQRKKTKNIITLDFKIKSCMKRHWKYYEWNYDANYHKEAKGKISQFWWNDKASICKVWPYKAFMPDRYASILPKRSHKRVWSTAEKLYGKKQNTSSRL